MSSYCGVIFFNLDTEKFLFLPSGDNVKVMKMLDLTWDSDLRNTVAKIRLEDVLARGKLFARVRRTSDERGIEDLVSRLNDGLAVKIEEFDDIFGTEKVYKFMVDNNPVDFEVSPIQISRVNSDVRYLTEEDFKTGISDLKEEITKEIKSLHGQFLRELKCYVGRIRKATDEAVVASVQISSPEVATESGYQVIKPENGVAEISQSERADMTNLIPTEKTFSFSTGDVERVMFANLPFDSDAQIREFFSVPENGRMLYVYTRKYFSNLNKITRGMKKILTKSYLCNHVWGKEKASLNYISCDRSLKHWMEMNFKSLHEETAWNIKMQRVFNDARFNRINRDKNHNGKDSMTKETDDPMSMVKISQEFDDSENYEESIANELEGLI